MDWIFDPKCESYSICIRENFIRETWFPRNFIREISIREIFEKVYIRKSYYTSETTSEKLTSETCTVLRSEKFVYPRHVQCIDTRNCHPRKRSEKKIREKDTRSRSEKYCRFFFNYCRSETTSETCTVHTSEKHPRLEDPSLDPRDHPRNLDPRNPDLKKKNKSFFGDFFPYYFLGFLFDFFVKNKSFFKVIFFSGFDCFSGLYQTSFFWVYFQLLRSKTSFIFLKIFEIFSRQLTF